jgi:putative transposase
MTAISPKAGSLARILGSYKSAVSKLAHKINGSFEWQERFHEHIIRDTLEYNRIEYYIIHNPESWDDDCFNKPPEETKNK